MNRQKPASALILPTAQPGPSTARTADYVTEELERRPTHGKGTDATEPYCDSETINRLCKEHLPRFHLPRLLRCGNRMFGATYKFTIVKGKFSLHHAWRWSDKKIFTLKLDKRDFHVVRWDHSVRSRLLGVDVPRLVHAERQDIYCLTIIEPMSVSLKWYMQYLMNNTTSPDIYYGMLLRTGRQCVRYLQRVHESGFLHGNINPHTFVFPTCLNINEGRPDFDRGPLIIDYGLATNWKEDPIYREEHPDKFRNTAIFARDGGMYTRRDDMENLGYLLLFLTKGFLRWELRTQRDLVMYGKKCISDLHKYVKGIPLKIKQYLTYIRILKWNEAPDYSLLEEILSNKKLDIRKEIKIRRERRSAEKLRLKRLKRAEEKALWSGMAVGSTTRGQITEGTRRTYKRDARKSLPSGTDPSRGADDEMRRCGCPATEAQVPSDLTAFQAINVGDSRSEVAELSSCPNCSYTHRKLNSIQHLDLKACAESRLKEKGKLMDSGRLDGLRHEELDSDSEPMRCTRDYRIGEVIDACEEDIEHDSEASMIGEVLDEQDELPDRLLGNERMEIKVVNGDDDSVDGVMTDTGQITALDVDRLFPFIPWENDPGQKHGWEDDLALACEDTLLFETMALDCRWERCQRGLVDLPDITLA